MNGDVSPIRALQIDREGLRRVLARAINNNQLTILSEMGSASGETITSLLNRVSKELGIPLSTLKFNAKILRKTGLISFGGPSEHKSAELTETGNFVLKILGGVGHG